MRKLIVLFSLGILSLLTCGNAESQVAAQAPIAMSGEVSMGHVHLLVSDVDANEKFWIAFGGKPIKLGDTNPVYGVEFPGGVRILLRKGNPTGPAVGSVVNHFGFYVPNVSAAMAKWKAAGLKTEAGRNNQQGFVWTPGDLVRIEILEMPGQNEPIVFHHVHFYVAPSSAGGIPAMQAWYAKMLGAVPGKRANFDIDNVPSGELSFAKSDTPTVPTAGRAVGDIGFQVKGLEAYCKRLEAAGVKFDTSYTKRPDLGIGLAFITDPWGTDIEFDEPLAQTVTQNR